MCVEVATSNLYAVSQRNCRQAPDTSMTDMGRRSGCSSSNRNWDGFTISHLHWVGVRATPQGLTSIAQQRVGLALLHEYCHRELAKMPFSVITKYEMLIFYSM